MGHAVGALDVAVLVGAPALELVGELRIEGAQHHWHLAGDAAGHDGDAQVLLGVVRQGQQAVGRVHRDRVALEQPLEPVRAGERNDHDDRGGTPRRRLDLHAVRVVPAGVAQDRLADGPRVALVATRDDHRGGAPLDELGGDGHR